MPTVTRVCTHLVCSQHPHARTHTPPRCSYFFDQPPFGNPKGSFPRALVLLKQFAMYHVRGRSAVCVCFATKATSKLARWLFQGRMLA